MLLQFVTRMNADYTITNHYRWLDGIHYRPLNKINVDGALSDDDVLSLLGEGVRLIKSGTTSQGYTRLLHI